ncbi:MAG: excinuclease ABC subunit UvrA [Acidobacteria bacterium]|nr:excinuclease ABC subunit UvrA [Acidobacteriota bacterium]
MLDRITVRGARQHNLKDVNVEIPRDSLTVITGLSGSGKSSLAFDTIYAEGQRRYVETLSPYARQFLDQMERPDVDSIEGLSPALSIEQKTTSRSPRSTVGTITEVYDYLRLLYSSIGNPNCPNCGTPIQRQSVEQIADRILTEQLGCKVMILAPIVRGRKGEYKKEFDRLARLGYVKARVDGELLSLEEDIHLDRRRNHTIEVVVDRLTVRQGQRKRVENSIQSASKLAAGLVVVAEIDGADKLYSEKLACTQCGASVPAFEPRSFSFNSPYGACETCNGLGSRWDFDPDKVIADPAKPLLDGGIVPGLLAPRVERYLAAGAKKLRIPLTKAFAVLTVEHQKLLLFGEEDAGSKGSRSGFIGLLRLLDDWHSSYATETFRSWLTRFMSPAPCTDCNGHRLRRESLAVKVAGLSIADFAALPVRKALEFASHLGLSGREKQLAGRIVEEVERRLRFLLAVGLDYLSLDRSAATLSGGEAQRVRLATQIGSELRGVLYVLDEPSIGLHARDNDRLLATLCQLRDLGNTILVVEHDFDTIQRADYVVDLGVGAGRLGGNLIANGTPAEVAQTLGSLTGQYLSGRKVVPMPIKRRAPDKEALTVRGACANNLKDIDVTFPLGRFIAVTGVSGSGKSTLVNDILYPALARKIYHSIAVPGAHRVIDGMEQVDKVIRIDQSAIGRTPRSNPATYTGVFTPIRALFAMLPESRARGYAQGRFSFNVKGGRCEACQGDGQIRIEMNFLPDVYVTCDSCRGRRYNHETLQVRYKGWSIADLLEATVEEAAPVMENLPQIQPKLQTLIEVGLGYIHLGQSSTTLSGGEAQRIKLARELSKRQTGRTLYLLDEPTTGLHFDDVKKLLEVLHRLADHGNTVIVIEHNLDVVKAADWVIDLGPEGGEQGGEVVVSGTPEDLMRAKQSYTGQALEKFLNVNGNKPTA